MHTYTWSHISLDIVCGTQRVKSAYYTFIIQLLLTIHIRKVAGSMNSVFGFQSYGRCSRLTERALECECLCTQHTHVMVVHSLIYTKKRTSWKYYAHAVQPDFMFVYTYYNNVVFDSVHIAHNQQAKHLHVALDFWT